MGKMHAELMRPARDGTCLDQRVSVFHGKHAVFGARGIGIGGIGRADLPQNDAFFGAVKACVDDTL